MKTNLSKPLLTSPDFFKAFTLLFAALVHLACFVSVVLYVPIEYYPGLEFWHYFFIFYTGFACFVVVVAIQQIREFFRTFDEKEAQRKSIEGYETIQHSVE